MKLKELKEIIDRQLKINPEREDLNVIIKTENHSYGAISSVNVKYANSGIDWNSSSFILTPEKELIEKEILTTNQN